MNHLLQIVAKHIALLEQGLEAYSFGFSRVQLLILLQLFLLPETDRLRQNLIGYRSSVTLNHNYVCHHPLCNLARFSDNISCLSLI